MRLLLLLLALPCTPALRYLVLRHGQTDHNRDGIIQGSSDASVLTDAGIAQARAAGAALAGLSDLSIARTYVSPLRRAKQTLELLRLSCALPAPTTLAALREIDLHSWEGRQKSELQRESPAAYAAWRSDPLAMEVDGHRPIVDLWSRARCDVWPAVRSGGGGGGPSDAALLVCHGSLGQALLCTALGLGEAAWRTHELPNCGLVEIDWPEEAPLYISLRLPTPPYLCLSPNPPHLSTRRRRVPRAGGGACPRRANGSTSRMARGALLYLFRPYVHAGSQDTFAGFRPPPTSLRDRVRPCARPSHSCSRACSARRPSGRRASARQCACGGPSR